MTERRSKDDDDAEYPCSPEHPVLDDTLTTATALRYSGRHCFARRSVPAVASAAQMAFLPAAGSAIQSAASSMDLSDAMRIVKTTQLVPRLGNDWPSCCRRYEGCRRSIVSPSGYGQLNGRAGALP
jgi:hypothetical protein